MTVPMPGGVEPSNLGKVFWPEDGLTKGDLLEYYRAVAPRLLSHLRHRPLTVKRYPDGIEGPFFYQKNTPNYAPDWVATVWLPAENERGEVRYPMCNDRRTLLWLGNQASIELHPWISRMDHLDRPDHLILDIDPPEGGFGAAVRAAQLVREVLHDHGLDGIAKTSGAKGMHVYVPLVRRHDYEQVRRAAHRVAAEAASREPGFATVEFFKKERAGRVFIDYTRVGPRAHIIATYSPRARPGATVSFPVPWNRLDRIDPREFTIRTVPPMLEDGDPWSELRPGPFRLSRDITAE
jgi:bifunctional non-homologous end joining protein LigD